VGLRLVPCKLGWAGVGFVSTCTCFFRFAVQVKKRAALDSVRVRKNAGWPLGGYLSVCLQSARQITGQTDVSAGKKQSVRPNRGGTLRPQAEAPRRHFLYTDVTQEEQQRIQQYCKEKQISVSQFFADLVLADAKKAASKRKQKQKVIVRAEFELTPEEEEKLELLTRVYQKDSIGEFIREIIQPNLEVQRLHAPLETTALRYYLSEEEHATVMKHIGNKGIAARNYAIMLALKALGKASKRRKPVTRRQGLVPPAPSE
jgi:hypothetical protein